MKQYMFGDDAFDSFSFGNGRNRRFSSHLEDTDENEWPERLLEDNEPWLDGDGLDDEQELDFDREDRESDSDALMNTLENIEEHDDDAWDDESSSDEQSETDDWQEEDK